MTTRSWTKLSVIIPAYNEERTISRVLKAVLDEDLSPQGLKTEVIVVDDGSSDATEDIIRSQFPQVVLLRHSVNRGKGAAIRTAIKAATGDILLIQDADQEYDPKEYPKLLEPILKGEARVVYGSRFMHTWYPKRMGVMHFLGNHLLTMMANVLFFAGITDESTCFKVFSTEILKSIPLECDGFDFCPEVTAKICRLGISIHEVPITYSARLVSEGKKIAWTDGIQAVKALLKYRFFSHQWKKDVPPEIHR